MKKLTAILFGLFILFTASVTPHLARAVETSFFNIIPCDAVQSDRVEKQIADAIKNAPELDPKKVREAYIRDNGIPECNFATFIKMIQNIIRAIIILAIPTTMIVLTWVGVVLLTSVGNVSKIQYAKGVAWKVIFGFITVLLAWLLVEAIYIAITGQGFNEFFK